MKRTVLLLLTCLLLALRTVAQAPEKAAPDDLVVTAEIIDHQYLDIDSSKGKTVLTFSAKLLVQNNTHHDRKIVVMFCDWEWSWTSQGAYRICGPSGCDANFPETIVIPSGQSVEFYDRLCPNKSDNQILDSPGMFRLGFIDLSEKGYLKFIRGKNILTNPRIYWSNQLRDGVRPVATEEVREKVLGRQHRLLDKDQ